MRNLLHHAACARRGDRIVEKCYSMLLVLLACLMVAPLAAHASCLDCHRDMQQGFNAAHAPLAQDCTRCHAGDASAPDATAAHHGLIAYPGDMDSAQQACGDCHADKVEGVTHSLMHSGVGMIATTRQAFGESPDRPGHNDLAHLTHSPADSLLRKQCASCHLGQKKTAHRLDTTRDRGGGCLACHINDQSSQTHPALTAQVSDARCFGCHSRSGRMSLSYAGLAETDSTSTDMQRLEDGRRVEFLPADRHHAAGMACIDCHTEKGLMGTDTKIAPVTQKQAVDIRCTDCHNISRTISPGQWPDQYRALLPRIPYPVETETRIPVTANGTPLWNIELRGEDAWLHHKLTDDRLHIPPYRDDEHPLAQEHSRLSCTSCHSQWAPQCYGCHLDYNASEPQYDHIAGQDTAGRWSSQRSDIHNDLPPMGVNASNRIVAVVPGMIKTITHPDQPEPRFARRFAEIEPHTTGPSRSCVSCHRSSTALGLGEGKLQLAEDGRIQFKPVRTLLDDGLPADAWTSLERSARNRGSTTLRPFSSQEMGRILAVPMPPAEKAGSTQ
jgi:predicted CXXCH cytochrome family protein